MFEKILKIIGIILALAIIGTIILFVVIIAGFSRNTKRLDEKRDERRAKLTEEFHRDMQQYYKLNRGDYTIVSDFFERGTSYSLIRFKIRGEDQVREVIYEYGGWNFKDMGKFPTPTATPTPPPTEVPRDLKGLRVTLLDWWSDESWDVAVNGYKEAWLDQLHQVENVYDFRIQRKGLLGLSGQEYAEAVYLSIANDEPLGQIITLESRWVSPLLSTLLTEGMLLDVSKAETVDWDDGKWNAGVTELMRISGKQYGFSRVAGQAGVGVFFNRQIFRELGITPDLPYDLQKEGKWSWEEFLQLCEKLTADTDNDGVMDVYAVTGAPYVLCNAALLANDTSVVTKDENGLPKANANDPSVSEALSFVRSLLDAGYYILSKEYYNPQSMFCEGIVAMYVDDEWVDTTAIRVKAPDLEYGFVSFPYGPNAGSSRSILNEDILVVPNCTETAERLDDILFAYNWYATVPEGYEYFSGCKYPYWQLSYDWKFNEDRAWDETIRFMFHDYPQTMQTGYLLPDYINESWPNEIMNGSEIEEVLEKWTPQWEEETEAFNAAFR